MEDWESDTIVEQWLRDMDDTVMPLPNIEFKPHLLISKVRKHYMEYLIKLLSVNYENHQKLLNKNIYLPSAIWRCAKIIETSAAQASMVVQMYRANITNVIKDLKTNTKKGLLFKKLYECLHYPPENDKKTQTSFSICNCQCSCNERKKNKKKTQSPRTVTTIQPPASNLLSERNITSQMESNALENISNNMILPEKLKDQMSMEIQSSDELMQQLEKIFQGDPNDDDLFDATFDATASDDLPKFKESLNETQSNLLSATHSLEIVKDVRESQKKCLDETLTQISGILVNNECNSQDHSNKNKKSRPSKWLCEEYFQKIKLFELLDQIRDCDRNKLTRIKAMLEDLFGEDSDDEAVVSPLEENSEFIISCKERIAPWVVKILTPYYVKGRIRGKSLFKSLAKHLIKLIYQCSKYPYEYEVQSFVRDFLNTHKVIRCEADFREFRIDNV